MGDTVYNHWWMILYDGWLMILYSYPIEYIGDYHHPLGDMPATNQYNGMTLPVLKTVQMDMFTILSGKQKTHIQLKIYVEGNESLLLLVWQGCWWIYWYDWKQAKRKRWCDFFWIWKNWNWLGLFCHRHQFITNISTTSERLSHYNIHSISNKKPIGNTNQLWSMVLRHQLWTIHQPAITNRRFPEIGVPPGIIHFSTIFHEMNHPAIGVPPWLWKPLAHYGFHGSPTMVIHELWNIHQLWSFNNYSPYLWFTDYGWLVVWNIFYCSIQWDFIIPTDELIFFRGFFQPPSDGNIWNSWWTQSEPINSH